MPLGAVLGGALARGYGLTSPLAVSGVLSLLSTVAALRWFTARDVAAALEGAARVPDPAPGEPSS
jgi:hypothetical protein